MSKQLIIVLILIVVVVAGATAWFLIRGEGGGAIPEIVPENTQSIGFPETSGRSPLNDDIIPLATAGDDTKTGNGFLSEATLSSEDRFMLVARGPVSGAVAVLRKKASSEEKVLSVRYMERATGHIKETKLDQGEPTRISNTTVPKVAETIFVPSGTQMILRVFANVFNEIETVLASVKMPIDDGSVDSPQRTIGTLDGVSIPEEVIDLAISPSGDEVIVLIPSADGVRGVLQSMTGENRREIFALPTSEWLVDWPSGSIISLNSRPLPGANGYLYFASKGEGVPARILGNEQGLTTLVSPNGTKLFAHTNTGKSQGVFLYDIPNAKKIGFPIFTLPEKCVWSKKVSSKIYCAVSVGEFAIEDGLPNSWYRGELQFEDTFWEINTETLATTYLGSPKETADAISPFLDPDENYLFYTNKRDGSLWTLSL